MKDYKLVAASGYFNPLHIGHVRYLEVAKRLGDYLVVIINNDEQVKLKKSMLFMPEDERVEIIRALRCVDEAYISIDNDKEVCDTLRMIKPHIFANGGDTKGFTRREKKLAKELDIKLVGNIVPQYRSSSKILKEYDENINNR